MLITTYEQEEVSTQGALGSRKGSRGLRVHPGVMQEASASFLSHTNSQCHTRLYRLNFRNNLRIPVLTTVITPLVRKPYLIK